MVKPPLSRVAEWLDAAEAATAPDARTATLATVSKAGWPTTRTVVVQHVGPQGLMFTTALTNLKARDLAARPVAALHFWWPQLRRQLRMTGGVVAVERAAVEEAWSQRPRHLQLIAVFSRQGQAIEDLEELRQTLSAATRAVGNSELPCPADYGGFRLQPSMLEFWAEEPDGLAVRESYELRGGDWEVRQLVP